jgi:hypothetical protein
MLMKGTIYGIFNEENNTCYIGSTIQKYPKRRYYRHKKDQFAYHYELFNCIDQSPKFKILKSGEYLSRSNLLKDEDVFIDCYKRHPSLTCCNKNHSFIPEDQKRLRATIRNRTYNKTLKGKEMRKWQNYRRKCRKKINVAIINR